MKNLFLLSGIVLCLYGCRDDFELLETSKPRVCCMTSTYILGGKDVDLSMYSHCHRQEIYAVDLTLLNFMTLCSYMPFDVFFFDAHPLICAVMLC